jgi:glucosamine 6-phosphate synthetase-like amidotransferase/phosphosugar isomerase protein
MIYIYIYIYIHIYIYIVLTYIIGREHAVASTKAFTTQVTVMTLIALWFRQTKEEREGLVESHLKTELLESLQRLPISFGMAMTTRDKCAKVCVYAYMYIYINIFLFIHLNTYVYVCKNVYLYMNVYKYISIYK